LRFLYLLYTRIKTLSYKSRPPTSIDVARLAGASQTTVSLVLTGRGDEARVSKATQQRVREAAATLNYVANRLARGLRSRATRAITVVIPSLENPFFAEVVGQAQEYGEEKGYSINVMVASSVEASRRVLGFLAGRSVDGVLLGVDSEPIYDLIKQLMGRGVACATLQATTHLPEDVPNISIDREGGGFLATNHLISLGHKRIGYITEYTDKAHGKYLGYRRALEATGLDIRDQWFATGKNTMAGGAEAMTSLFSQSGTDRPTALFAYNDLMAIGALRVLKEDGIRVPHDFAVVGFDGTSVGAFTNPALTTVSHHRNTVAIEVLFAMLENSKEVLSKYDVPISLTVRESCGASIGAFAKA
jgi:DNA-binding LacI/PurR family transcriptional regulator